MSRVRLRILGWLVVVLAITNVVSVLLQRKILLDRLDSEVDAHLVQEVEELTSLSQGRDPSTGQPFGSDVVPIFDTFLRRNIPHEGEALFTLVDGRAHRTAGRAPYSVFENAALMARWSNLAESDEGRIDTPAGSVRYLAVPLVFEGQTKGVFVVANFLANERQEVESAVRVGAIVSLSVLVGASALAWVVAGRVLAPVRVLTETAHAITETDLRRRIPVHGDDEIGELAKTFNTMLDRLESAFSAQRAFLDDASHELRTPITIIRGHLEVMGDEDPEERRQTVELVIDELDRMGRMVDEMLLLAKAQRPDFLQLEPVDLALFTREVLSKASALAPRTWELDGVGVATIVADRQRLTQATMNLARNAAQHTAEGESVAIGSSAADGWVRLWVRDCGPGVAPGDRERIFDRFGRGETALRRSDGAGLGLAIALAIAEAHHGRIEVDSTPGDGATFTVVVPAARIE